MRQRDVRPDDLSKTRPAPRPRNEGELGARRSPRVGFAYGGPSIRISPERIGSEPKMARTVRCRPLPDPSPMRRRISRLGLCSEKKSDRCRGRGAVPEKRSRVAAVRRIAGKPRTPARRASLRPVLAGSDANRRGAHDRQRAHSPDPVRRAEGNGRGSGDVDHVRAVAVRSQEITFVQRSAFVAGATEVG